MNEIGGFISKYPATPDDAEKQASNSLVQKFLEPHQPTALSFARFSIFAGARATWSALVRAAGTSSLTLRTHLMPIRGDGRGLRMAAGTAKATLPREELNLEMGRR